MISLKSKLIRLLITPTVFVMLFFVRVEAQSDTIQTTVPALKKVFAKDFYIGCLLSYRNIGLPDDPIKGSTPVATPNGGYLIKYHMNSMSPGNNLKPQYTVNMNASIAAYNAATSQAAKDSVDTHPVITFNADIIAQLAWAKRQGFTFRGHTLVWYNQTPGTGFFCTGYSSVGTRLTKEKMTARLENYIKEVIRLIHEGWPGLLSAFDVVNEAVNEDGTDRQTSNEWYTTFQDNSYIMKAFEFTRKYTVQYGETQIKLYYNDYNTSTASKANGIVRVCTPIFQAGLLDGIGMQEHDANTSPTAAQWIATYNKFFPICNEMAITELDVSTGSTSPSAALFTQQANQYAQLFKCFVERSYKSGRGKIISVSKDGLNDAYTMTTQASSLWDSKNLCKPAFYAVVDVGTYYNKLDSLITYINALKQNEYSSASWSNLSTVLTAAKSAKDQNYDYSTSAATALNTAFTNLNSSVKGLVKAGTDVNTADDNLPKEFMLSQNYPNPFNPSTQIKYSIPQNGFVSLTVYNLLGEKIKTLFEGIQNAGNYTAAFDSSGLTSGIYFYSLKASNFSQTRKLMLLK
jgi:endo-1,4-beta-xylanase